MYHPTTRVLTVLELLQSHQRLSGAELARRLEVDVRTVRRYVAMLQDMGVPIEAERGRYGAYGLRPGFKLPPLMFTEDEAVALALGLLAAHRTGLAAVTPAMEGALAKIERVLPDLLRERVQSLRDTIVVDLPAPAAPPASTTIAVFSHAAGQQRTLHMRYRAAHSEETLRQLDPYGLVYHQRHWYGVGFCHLRGAERLFRLDRVLAAELTERSFRRPAGFDCLEFLRRTIASIPDTWHVEVLLHGTLASLRSLVPPALALLEQVADGVLLRCYAHSLPDMARALVALRCRFEVQQPPELRAALRDLAAEVAALAAD